MNGCDIYLTIHMAHMSQPVEVSGISDALRKIEEDVTGYGQSYAQAMRERLWYYLRDGKVACLVDAPERTAKTLKDAEDAGERSFQITYTAQRIWFWKYFTDGKFRGKLQEIILQDDPWEDPETGELFEQYRRFVVSKPGAKCQWMRLRAIEPIDPDLPLDVDDPRVCNVEASGTYRKIDFVPVFIHGKGACDSFLSDIWPLDMAIMNLTSVRQNINYFHGFPRNILSGVKREEITKMAEWTITLVADPECKVHTINPGDPESIVVEINDLKRQKDQRGLLRMTQLSDDTRQVQSSEAKALDMLQQIAFYDETLDGAVAMERQVWRTTALFERATSKEIDVSIDRDYGLSDPDAVERELASAEASAERLNCLPWQKELAKIRASRQRYVPSSKETEDQIRERVYKDIESATGMLPAGGPNALGGGTPQLAQTARDRMRELMGTPNPKGERSASQIDAPKPKSAAPKSAAKDASTRASRKD